MNCIVVDCQTPSRIVKGYCLTHYRRNKVSGQATKTVFDIRRESKVENCAVESCSGISYSMTYCHAHYRRLQTYGNPTATDLLSRPYGTKKCTIDGCEKKHNAKGYCFTHYNRWRRYGDPHITKEQPSRVSPGGYVWRGSNAEHRTVMEEILGRKLVPGENVHHLNGDRSDNRPENLELWSRKQPYGQRVTDKVNYAKEILSLYAPELLKEENND